MTADVPLGTYTAGVDVPAGSYTIHCSTDDDTHGFVYAAAPDDDLDNGYPSILNEYVSTGEDKTFYVTLQDGDRLCLQVPGTVSLSQGIVFS